MSQINKLTQKVLLELHSTKELISTVEYLVELLENKVDPDLNEIKTVDLMYQFLEKFKMLEEGIKDRTNIVAELDGDRLDRLYNF